MKHYGIIMIALVLLICAMASAAEVNSISAPKARFEADTYIVPIELTNTIPMSAMDLPLKFSEGVTLKEVQFEGTRSADFDFKWANIDNVSKTVVIGLIPMIYGENSDLAPGTGSVANLVFTVDDPAVKTIEVTPTTTKDPDHSLMLVYFEKSAGGVETKGLTPEFQGVSVVLSEVAGKDLLPTSYSLKQNAPNPFNPITRILYDLPKATSVRLDIYNVLGQKVKTLVNDFQSAGSKSVIWDGRSNSGSEVSSGVYFYRLETSEYSATMKMMMLK